MSRLFAYFIKAFKNF